VIDLETLISARGLIIPEDVDLVTAVNFTKNYVVTETGQIIEKLSEGTERLMILIGAVFSIAALAFSLCSKARSGR
jgi:hypothetical protein